VYHYLAEVAILGGLSSHGAGPCMLARIMSFSYFFLVASDMKTICVMVYRPRYSLPTVHVEKSGERMLLDCRIGP